MSRIRGIELKVQKEILQSQKYDHNENLKRKHREQEPPVSKEDVESNQISELLQKLPQLDKIFEIHRKIGEGTFSSVYLGSLRQHAKLSSSEKKWFAIKHLVPTSHPARIEHELRCLQEMGGKNHVIGVDLCLRHLDTVVFVMPYIPHKRFSEYVGAMDAAELREYMRALLAALAHVHSFGVIHRDVKPGNFLYDRDNRRYMLVDFGLAQRVSGEGGGGGGGGGGRAAARARCGCAGRGGVCGACAARPGARAARAGTQGYRPPEVLLKVAAQGAAVDVWAAGVVLAGALAARYPLLRAPDDVSALAELNDLLGSAELRAAARALGRRVVVSCERRGVCLRKLTALSRGAAPAAPPVAPPCRWCARAPPRCVCRDDSDQEEGGAVCGFPGAAFSLARRLLAAAPAQRPTAARALHHAFFTETAAAAPGPRPRP